MTENQTKSLIPIEDSKALAAFRNPGGLEPLLQAIEKECRQAPAVTNTENGRKNIASLAYKIAQAKNRLDEIGKGLTEESRTFIKTINDARSDAWDRLEALQKEIRRPLDEWEQKEKERIAGHEKAIADIQAFAIFPAELPPPSSAQIEERIAGLKAQPARAFEEYETRAARITGETLDALNEKLKDALVKEAIEAENKRWESIFADADRENREFDIARAAATAAREAAEEKARKEKEEAAAQNAIALIWEQAHRENAEFDQRQAEARAEAEEAQKWAAIFAAADAENDSFDIRRRAAENARQEAARAAEKAAQDERDKIAREEEEKKRAQAARDADAANRQKKNGEAQDALEQIIASFDTMEDIAFEIVTAISKGEIPHVSIKY